MDFPITTGNKGATLDRANTQQKLYTVQRIIEWIEDPWSESNQPIKEQWKPEENGTPPTPCVSSGSENSVNIDNIKNLIKECEQTITELQKLLKHRTRDERKEQQLQLTELCKLMQDHHNEKTQQKPHFMHSTPANR